MGLVKLGQLLSTVMLKILTENTLWKRGRQILSLQIVTLVLYVNSSLDF